MEERLQKIISAAGIASRRAAEELITEGRVRVNGKVVTELGSRADPDKDHIKVDGKLINPQQPKTYLMLNKPVGYVTTLSDPEGRPIVQDLLKNVKVRVYPVGRLDYNTEGMLLLTNDGEFAHLVTHPKHELPKRYLAKIKGALTDDAVEKLESGVFLADGKTAPARVRRLRKEEANSWVEITIHEGRKRQVRRMFDHVGHSVIRLRRVRVGNLPLGELPPGAFRHLTGAEVKALRDMAEGEQLRIAEFGMRNEKQQAGNRALQDYDVKDEMPAGTIPSEKKPKRDRRSMEPPDIAIMPKQPRMRPKKRAAGPSEERPFRAERGARPARPGQGPQGTRFERPSGGAFRGRPRPERPAFGERRPAAGERPRRPMSGRDERGGARFERPASGGYRGKPGFGRPETSERPRRPMSGRGEREGAKFERPASGGYRGKPSYGRAEAGERQRRPATGGYRSTPGADRPTFSERGPRPGRPRTEMRSVPDRSVRGQAPFGMRSSRPANRSGEEFRKHARPAEHAGRGERKASRGPREETWTSNRPFDVKRKPDRQSWRKPAAGGRRPGEQRRPFAGKPRPPRRPSR